MESHFPQIQHSASRQARERVADDLSRLIADSEMLLKATASDLSGQVQDARARVMSALDNARQTCVRLSSAGWETARTSARKTDRTIRNHPYEAIGLALGVAALMAFLMHRNSDHEVPVDWD